jgi:hypothetical protein
VRDALPRILATGALPVLIGHGSPDDADRLRRDLAVPDALPLMTDPRRTSYTAAGWRRSLAGVLSPSTLSAGARAWRRGNRLGRLAGDPLQLGGVLVVDPDHSVRFHHASRFAGDHPDMEAVLAALAS